MEFNENDIFQDHALYYENEAGGFKESNGAFQDNLGVECYNNGLTDFQNSLYSPRAMAGETEDNIRNIKREILDNSKLIEKIKRLSVMVDERDKEKERLIKDMFLKSRSHDETMKKKENELANSNYLIQQLEAKIRKLEDNLKSINFKETNKEKEEELKKSVLNLKNEVNNKTQIIHCFEDSIKRLEEKLKKKKEKIQKANQSLRQVSEELILSKNKRQEVIDKTVQTDLEYKAEPEDRLPIILIDSPQIKFEEKPSSSRELEIKVERTNTKYKKLKARVNHFIDESYMISSKVENLSKGLSQKRDRLIEPSEIEALMPDIVKKICLEKSFISQFIEKASPFLREVMPCNHISNESNELYEDEKISPQNKQTYTKGIKQNNLVTSNLEEMSPQYDAREDDFTNEESISQDSKDSNFFTPKNNSQNFNSPKNIIQIEDNVPNGLFDVDSNNKSKSEAFKSKSEQEKININLEIDEKITRGENLEANLKKISLPLLTKEEASTLNHSISNVFNSGPAIERNEKQVPLIDHIVDSIVLESNEKSNKELVAEKFNTELMAPEPNLYGEFNTEKNNNEIMEEEKVDSGSPEPKPLNTDVPEEGSGKIIKFIEQLIKKSGNSKMGNESEIFHNEEPLIKPENCNSNSREVGQSDISEELFNELQKPQSKEIGEVVNECSKSNEKDLENEGQTLKISQELLEQIGMGKESSKLITYPKEDVEDGEIEVPDDNMRPINTSARLETLESTQETYVKIKKKVKNDIIGTNGKAVSHQVGNRIHEILKNKIDLFLLNARREILTYQGFQMCLEIFYELYYNQAPVLEEIWTLFPRYNELLELFIEYFAQNNYNSEEITNCFLVYFNKLSTYSEPSLIITIFLKITDDLWEHSSLQKDRALQINYLGFCEKVVLSYPLNLKTANMKLCFFKDLTKDDQLRQLKFFSQYFIKDLINEFPALQEILVFSHFIVNYESILTNPQVYSYENCVNIYGKRIDHLNPLKQCIERTMLLILGLYGMKRAGNFYDRRAKLIQMMMDLLQMYRNPKGVEKENFIVKNNIINLLYIIVVIYPSLLKFDGTPDEYIAPNSMFRPLTLIECQPLNSLFLNEYTLDETVKSIPSSVICLRATLLIFLRDLIKDSNRETDVTKGQIMLLVIYSIMSSTGKNTLSNYFFPQNLLGLKNIKLSENSKLKIINKNFDEKHFIKILVESLLENLEKKLYIFDDVVSKQFGEIVNVHINIRDFFNSISHLFKFVFLPIPFPTEITPFEENLFSVFVHEQIKGYFVNMKYNKTLQKVLATNTLKFLQKMMANLSPKYSKFVESVSELLFTIENGLPSEEIGRICKKLDPKPNFFAKNPPTNINPNIYILNPNQILFPPSNIKRNIQLKQDNGTTNPRKVNNFIPTLPPQMIEQKDQFLDFR